MRGLFWRIFAAFWLVSVALIVSLSWTATAHFESAKIPGLGITRQLRDDGFCVVDGLLGCPHPLAIG